jgi:hypothetical protein
MYVCVHAYMYMYMYMYMCICVYMCICTYIYIYIHICVYAYIYSVCVHTYIYAHTCQNMSTNMYLYILFALFNELGQSMVDSLGLHDNTNKIPITENIMENKENGSSHISAQ